jgi:hypothetical protein
MKLLKEQQADCIVKLSHPYGRVALLCDGRKITLSVEQYKGLSFRVMTYVDGHFLGKWISGTEEYSEQKFLRKVVKPIYSSAMRKKLIKIMGVRRFNTEPDYHKTYTVFYPDWHDGKAAINHLCKVCESVELLGA